MGGGHLTRANGYANRLDPKDPMAEFYLIFQEAAGKQRSLQLPGCWAFFTPDFDEMLYEEDLDGCCRFVSEPGGGAVQVFPPKRLGFLNSTLMVTPDGVPSALLFTAEAGRLTYAVQLRSFTGLEVPAVPNCGAALSLELSPADPDLADTDPAALGRHLMERTEGKRWLYHPDIEKWKTHALSAAQREYRRRHGNHYFG